MFLVSILYVVYSEVVVDLLLRVEFCIMYMQVGKTCDWAQSQVLPTHTYILVLTTCNTILIEYPFTCEFYTNSIHKYIDIMFTTGVPSTNKNTYVCLLIIIKYTLL